MEQKILVYANHFKRFYGQSFQTAAERFALSQLEIDILLFLHNNPACNTARDIVERRGVAKSNVSTATEALRARGYLSARADPHNRKVQRLAILPGAQEAVEALTACQEQCFAAVMEGFTPQERQTLEQFLQRLDENVVAASKKLDAAERDGR